MKQSGIELIAKEREEQFKKHGRTISDDAMQNCDFELVRGAIALLEKNELGFPSSWSKKICAKMIKKTYKERVIIAGALLCAEIDRIQLFHNGRVFGRTYKKKKVVLEYSIYCEK